MLVVKIAIFCKPKRDCTASLTNYSRNFNHVYSFIRFVVNIQLQLIIFVLENNFNIYLIKNLEFLQLFYYVVLNKLKFSSFFFFFSFNS